ncbi:LPXTG cell wall anchor domain-containing protein [Alkalibacillus almallahensis]|uniref:LPXTG cell wall anchor domain-containing protein n=1 Tax=Alkalibacillus almallahensis TaxID=1379154 RepID=UPI00141FC164|nr:LPXTG cell wall anchor domain-containing protein [Alkalibacillus almallahensis]NIK11913.1 LPXTG-motif cell wall-anchored protein [Alkalibacillus almallahensis]
MRSLFVTFIILLMLSMQPIVSQADDHLFSVSPDDVMFEVDQLKPGDYMTETVRVENHHESPLVVIGDSEYLHGSNYIYEQLELTVKDDQQTILYQGSLANFIESEMVTLDVEDEEELLFHVEFPMESDNSYQGLNIGVQLSFSTQLVEDNESVPGEEDRFLPFTGGSLPGGLLPQTGETIPYPYYVIGVLLVSAGICLMLWHKRLKEMWVND